MIGTIVGNQHGVSFTLEVGIPRDGDNDGVKELVTALEGSQVSQHVQIGSGRSYTTCNILSCRAALGVSYQPLRSPDEIVRETQGMVKSSS